mmetsp:Transcript_34699/g.83849  ORF Transcript_34699/g.83849 Transcript_34699/m.83849 type:complete len:107 (-) Transcript_34699:68-388(-)
MEAQRTLRPVGVEEKVRRERILRSQEGDDGTQEAGRGSMRIRTSKGQRSFGGSRILEKLVSSLRVFNMSTVYTILITFCIFGMSTLVHLQTTMKSIARQLVIIPTK